MWKAMNRSWKKRFPVAMAPALLLALGSMSWPCSSFAGDTKLSEEHSMHLDPAAIQKVGEANYKLLLMYFHDAERAIESENLADLMALYSEKYTNRDHGKEFAEGVWRKIFADFNDVSSRHSIKLLTYDETGGLPVVVLECSGLLQGIPEGGDRPVAIDSWDKQWHVLVNEDRWRLFGNSGESKRRFGDDDHVMHPLF